MALAHTGALSMRAVRAELGLDGTFNVGSTAPRRLSGALAGALSMRAFRGCHYIKTGGANLSLFALLGNPSTAKTWRVVLAPNTTIGSGSTSTPALSFGNFPAGSDVTFDAYGPVIGAGGPATSRGGPALNTSTTTAFTKKVTVYSGGSLLGGGGGGGIGGTGGQGGQGGPGTVSGTDDRFSLTNPLSFWRWTTAGGGITAYWNGTLVASQGGGDSVTSNNGYYRGALVSTENGDAGEVIYTYRIYVITSVPTTGGAGGAGGGGGWAGKGQGYDNNTPTNGAGGSAGAAGAPGGTNAGAGGAGGTGGTGGAGALYGASGAPGTVGAAGGTGNAGNAGGGSAGLGGQAGSAGGLGGYYLQHGGQAITFTNSGGQVLGYNGA